ncbi:hypothetical protein HK15_02535 [Acetobacter orientalis]|uniref:Uncharacterized protein n=1 Tax=Acetobacter orientalis TaxID=146474 RepID=A0A252AZK3_9PROT|nr:hypothetical protein HK15_02535 [Acetobacter orientalis]
MVTVGFLQQADHLKLEDKPKSGLGLQRKAVHLVVLVDLLKARSLPLRAFVISRGMIGRNPKESKSSQEIRNLFNAIVSVRKNTNKIQSNTNKPR